MKRVSHFYMIAICILAIGALFGVLFLHSSAENQRVLILADKKAVQAGYNHVFSIGETTLNVARADTPALREQGLSGVPHLSEGTGMYFVFDTPDMYGFWMKDMQFPLDLIWIDAQGTVVGITSDVKPETYPAIFYPPVPVVAVLEVAAGFSTGQHIEVGDHATFVK